MTHTKDRLAADLNMIGLHDMAAEATAGRYDDYLSESATPITDLVLALRKVGTNEAIDLAMRAMDGAYDATDAEAEAWSETNEAQALFHLIKGGDR